MHAGAEVFIVKKEAIDRKWRYNGSHTQCLIPPARNQQEMKQGEVELELKLHEESRATGYLKLRSNCFQHKSAAIG
jgi:hypothetical protein